MNFLLHTFQGQSQCLHNRDRDRTWKGYNAVSSHQQIQGQFCLKQKLVLEKFNIPQVSPVDVGVTVPSMYSRSALDEGDVENMRAFFETQRGVVVVRQGEPA